MPNNGSVTVSKGRRWLPRTPPRSQQWQRRHDYGQRHGSLTLDDSSSISGGKVTIAGWSGKLTLNGTSGISGGELDNSGTVTTTGTDTIGTETITNSDAIDVTGGTLTLSADSRCTTMAR